MLWRATCHDKRSAQPLPCRRTGAVHRGGGTITPLTRAVANRSRIAESKKIRIATISAIGAAALLIAQSGAVAAPAGASRAIAGGTVGKGTAGLARGQPVRPPSLRGGTPPPPPKPPKLKQDQRVDANDLIKKRGEIARKFYRDAGYPQSSIENHLKGIDFTRPVEVRTLTKGSSVVQYVRQPVPGRAGAPMLPDRHGNPTVQTGGATQYFVGDPVAFKPVKSDLDSALNRPLKQNSDSALQSQRSSGQRRNSN